MNIRLIEDYIDMIPDQREPLHKLVEFTPMTVRQDGEIQQVRCLIEEEKSKKVSLHFMGSS